MDLRLLRSFIAVAEEGHVGRAARRLHLAQPPLSRQLQQLGAAIGAPVVERDGRGIRLTAAGRALLPEAKAILAHAETARRRARDAAAGVSGLLRIGYVDSSAFSGTVPDLLRRFRAANPGIEVELFPHRSLEQWPLLRDERIDMGILYWPPEEPGFASVPIETDNLRLVLPTGHPLCRRRRICVADLGDERFISFPSRNSPRYHAAIRAAFQQRGCTFQVRLEAPHELLTLGLVAAGMGPALVVGACAVLHPPGVVFKHVADLDVALLVSACWRKNRAADPVVAAFRRIVS